MNNIIQMLREIDTQKNDAEKLKIALNEIADLIKQKTFEALIELEDFREKYNLWQHQELD